MDLGWLLYRKTFNLKQKLAVYKSYERATILNVSEVLCLRENGMGMLRRIEIHGESNVWRTAQRLKKSQDLDADGGFK